MTEKALLEFAAALSVAFTVKLNVPEADGVPASTPAALSVNPSGNAPALTAHEYPGVPPLAENVCEYAAPTVPAARLAGMIDIPGRITVPDPPILSTLQV